MVQLCKDNDAAKSFLCGKDQTESIDVVFLSLDEILESNYDARGTLIEQYKNSFVIYGVKVYDKIKDTVTQIIQKSSTKNKDGVMVPPIVIGMTHFEVRDFEDLDYLREAGFDLFIKKTLD